MPETAQFCLPTELEQDTVLRKAFKWLHLVEGMYPHLALAAIKHAQKLGLEPFSYKIVELGEARKQLHQTLSASDKFDNPENLTRKSDFVGFEVEPNFPRLDANSPFHGGFEYFNFFASAQQNLKVVTEEIDAPYELGLGLSTFNAIDHFESPHGAYGYKVSISNPDLLIGNPEGCILINTLDRNLAQQVHNSVFETVAKTPNEPLEAFRLFMGSSEFSRTESQQHPGKALVERIRYPNNQD